MKIERNWKLMYCPYCDDAVYDIPKNERDAVCWDCGSLLKPTPAYPDNPPYADENPLWE
jgi:RNase P subunit RPR2